MEVILLEEIQEIAYSFDRFSRDGGSKSSSSNSDSNSNSSNNSRTNSSSSSNSKIYSNSSSSSSSPFLPTQRSPVRYTVLDLYRTELN